MQLKKNIHIQLFDDKGLTSERMVAQEGEFYAGPKDKHKGPMRIMFTIEDKDDATGAIKYLEQLALDAPIREKGVQGRKSTTSKDVEPDNSLEVLLEEAKKAAGDDQDKFIKHLRGTDFVFLDSDNLKLKIPETYEIKKRHLEKYQWLIRRTRAAKDPRNDRYDPQFFIGISILEGRSDKMVLYLYSELKGTMKIPVPENKAIDFKKTNLIKYPHYMTPDERLKWGMQHRDLLNNTEKPKSKFYARWEKDVKVGNELKLKR